MADSRQPQEQEPHDEWDKLMAENGNADSGTSEAYDEWARRMQEDQAAFRM
jgi:hypothetical protein